MKDLFINPFIMIAGKELEERYIRSSGPGGQNVNKVSSAVQLRFDVAGSQSLPPTVRESLLKIATVSRDGYLVILAQRFREREKNRADARARLAEIIRRAATPKKSRCATRVPRASRLQRLENKKRRGQIKKIRHGHIDMSP